MGMVDTQGEYLNPNGITHVGTCWAPTQLQPPCALCFESS